MTPAFRRPATAALIGAAVVTLTAGCVFTPPGVPAAPAATTESSAAPVEPTESASSEAAEPSETAAGAAEGPYEITAEGQDDSVWSFEVTDSRIVEADSNGKVAEPGNQLVEVLIDAELLEGEPNFYTAFHVYVVNDATGEEYGLSTGTNFYAENDLFAAGRDASFTGGVGIYQVPAGIGVDHVRVTTDQGGAWDFTR